MTEYLKLKKSNCKNCYKCIRNCPVKSIRFSDNQANIIAQDCILCGHCFLACPQNAKEIRNDVEKAEQLINSGSPVYVSMAPSFIANYNNVTIAAMEKALQKLGFAKVEETADGAAMVASQYENIVADGKQEVVISTCCHTVNLLIQKYYPEIIPYMAPVITPMQAHCKDIKRRILDAKTVFVGPCISKKAEVEICDSDVDCVLTFEELSSWLESKNITFEKVDDKNKKFNARLFPTVGGILKTMVARKPEYTYIAIDGIENCIQAIKDIKTGNLNKCFIEMSACQGSCICGPVMDKSHRMPIRDYISVTDYASQDGKIIPGNQPETLNKNFTSMASKNFIIMESAIEEVLREMGKTKPEHELNCGSCGYNSCREKARAVIEGKANLTMCLPYLKEKAESFSDTIIKNTPNAIIVVNESLDVKLINTAACKLLKINSPGEILGDNVVRVLDPTDFVNAFQKGKNMYDKTVYLAEYQKYVEQTVLYDGNYHIIICIMRDVTAEISQQESRMELSRRTIEITDKVIAKQMRTVQEIASLLGETTAETKVALTKLKESLHDE